MFPSDFLLPKNKKSKQRTRCFVYFMLLLFVIWNLRWLKFSCRSFTLWMRAAEKLENKRNKSKSKWKYLFGKHVFSTSLPPPRTYNFLFFGFSFCVRECNVISPNVYIYSAMLSSSLCSRTYEICVFTFYYDCYCFLQFFLLLRVLW